MSPRSEHRLWLVLVTVLAALSLEVAPLPGRAGPWAPPWLALVIVYWSLAFPRRYGFALAWISGLVLDVLKGGLLGQHALALTVVAGLTLRFHLRLRLFPIWQQAAAVGVLAGIHEFLIFWVDGIAGEAGLTWDRVVPPVVAALLWPLIAGAVDGLRRWARAA